MGMLDRKLLRDLRAGKRQFGAVAVVIALGIALYVGSAMSYVNLGSSYERSYDALGFADFTVSCERAPDSVVARARALPGVTGVEGRWVEDLIIEKSRRPAAVARGFAGARELRGRVISTRDRGV